MRRKKLPPKGWNKDHPFGLGGPLNSGHGDLAPARGALSMRDAPPIVVVAKSAQLRAPFPPAAKTAPAPLLLLSPPRGARRGPRIETSKKMRRARWKRKRRFGGSVCASADLLPPARDGWQSLAAVRDGNARPLGRPLARGSWGWPGEVGDTLCSSFRCRWPVVDEGFSIGQRNSSYARRGSA